VGSFDTKVVMPVTTDLHVRFDRQPRSSPVRAEGRIIYRGRRLMSIECVITDADAREVARTTGTYMLVPRPTDE
jgi:acyl-coenzyme A thioesterase PaaI-like protein